VIAATNQAGEGPPARLNLATNTSRSLTGQRAPAPGNRADLEIAKAIAGVVNSAIRNMGQRDQKQDVGQSAARRSGSGEDSLFSSRYL